MNFQEIPNVIDKNIFLHFKTIIGVIATPTFRQDIQRRFSYEPVPLEGEFETVHKIVCAHSGAP